MQARDLLFRGCDGVRQAGFGVTAVEGRSRMIEEIKKVRVSVTSEGERLRNECGIERGGNEGPDGDLHVYPVMMKRVMPFRVRADLIAVAHDVADLVPLLNLCSYLLLLSYIPPLRSNKLFLQSLSILNILTVCCLTMSTPV